MQPDCRLTYEPINSFRFGWKPVVHRSHREWRGCAHGGHSANRRRFPTADGARAAVGHKRTHGAGRSSASSGRFGRR